MYVSSELSQKNAKTNNITKLTIFDNSELVSNEIYSSELYKGCSMHMYNKRNKEVTSLFLLL